ncbi:MAG TPA: hypothetical protein VE263_06830 [Candidatus Angelobacter sp.]|nr:hypothetical protein [Candidatus Angelobacter sp.]
MKNESGSFLTRGLFLLAITCLIGLAGQIVSAQQADLYKEVMAKKETIVWKPAPANLMPAPVCNILQVCAGEPDKVIALPIATENGQKVQRGLILTKMQDAKHTDAIVMLNQSLDIYFFVVAPDGSLQKTAYHQAGGATWLAMANSLAQPIFAKDEKIWHDRVAQLGGAPAAAPAAATKPAGQ